MKRPNSDNSVSIATLKTHISKYLREVGAGREIVITDHRRPVARLVPFESELGLITIRPKTSLSEAVRKMRQPKLKGSIDSLSFLLKERGTR